MFMAVAKDLHVGAINVAVSFLHNDMAENCD